jgi:hypothetical protein
MMEDKFENSWKTRKENFELHEKYVQLQNEIFFFFFKKNSYKPPENNTNI